MSSKTNRVKFLKSMGLPDDVSLSLEDIATLSGMPIMALRLVYNRGVGAWKTNPESVRVKGTFGKVPSAPRQSKLSKEQWGIARVYAFVMKTDKVYYGADDDIRIKYELE
jgi:hypothetical protein